MHASAHSTWVKQHLDEGTYLFAGPKKSGLGGVILVKSIPRKELQTLLSEDSYIQAEIADYPLVDFDCKLMGPKNLGRCVKANDAITEELRHVGN